MRRHHSDGGDGAADPGGEGWYLTETIESDGEGSRPLRVNWRDAGKESPAFTSRMTRSVAQVLGACARAGSGLRDRGRDEESQTTAR